MIRIAPIFAVVSSFALTPLPAVADEPVVFASTSAKTPIVELYTSEGCSSCPPADRWLSRLGDDDGLWTDFVPLAFHVSYWNYLGWRDAWADEAFDQRQRRRAAQAGSGVYTPGVFVDGAEYRGWRRQPAAPKQGGKQQPGALTVEINNGVATARFDAATGTAPTHLEFALLSSGLGSEVRAGENRGRRLRHDFVVVDLARHRLSRTDDGWEATFAVPKTTGTTQPAVAAWVVDRRGTPIQATGGWL